MVAKRDPGSNFWNCCGGRADVSAIGKPDSLNTMTVEELSAINATGQEPSRKVQNADISAFFMLYVAFKPMVGENAGSLGMRDSVVNIKVFTFRLGNR